MSGRSKKTREQHSAGSSEHGARAGKDGRRADGKSHAEAVGGLLWQDNLAGLMNPFASSTMGLSMPMPMLPTTGAAPFGAGMADPSCQQLSLMTPEAVTSHLLNPQQLDRSMGLSGDASARGDFQPTGAGSALRFPEDGVGAFDPWNPGSSMWGLNQAIMSQESIVGGSSSSLLPPSMDAKGEVGKEDKAIRARMTKDKERKERNSKSSQRARDKRKKEEKWLRDQIEAKEMYRKMIEGGPDIISLHDMDANALFRHVSPALKRLTGIEPSEVVGKGLLDLVHVDDRNAVSKSLAQVILRQKGHCIVPYCLKTPGDRFLPVESSIRLGHGCIITVTRLRGKEGKEGKEGASER
ncbi:unnamed protein product [Discosporangium mesarthrocarpum]